MNDILSMIYGFARGAWRRRRLALITAWAVAVCAWAVTLLLEDRYLASARVFVDVKTALQPVLRGIAVESDYQSQLALVQEALLSRPQLEAVARKTNLDAKVSTRREMESLVTKLQKQIRVVSSASQVGRQNSAAPDTIYTISYLHPNRERSVAVVRELLRNFQDGTANGNREGGNGPQAFLDRQIKEALEVMRAGEAKLAEFQKVNLNMLPGEKGDYFARYAQERGGEQQAKTALAVAQGQQAELRRQLAATPKKLPGSSGSADGSPDTATRLRQAEKEREELLLTFDERYPAVVAVTRNIEALKERLATELAELQRGGSASGLSSFENPLYQQTEAELRRLQVEIARHQAALRQHQREIARLEQFVDQYPEVQMRLTDLMRDVSSRKDNYEKLLQRRQETKVADDAAETGIVRFEIIEPPRAAETPVWPTRPLFILAGLFGALAVGLALAMIPDIVAPKVHDQSLLERQFGLPVLGAVSALRDNALVQQERHALRNTLLGTGALVALAGFLVMLGGRISAAILN